MNTDNIELKFELDHIMEKLQKSQSEIEKNRVIFQRTSKFMETNDCTTLKNTF